LKKAYNAPSLFYQGGYIKRIVKIDDLRCECWKEQQTMKKKDKMV